MGFLIEIAGILIGVGYILFSITFHEFGHFIMAKAFKFHIIEFAIGFGPKLFSVRKKPTEYSVRWLPLGGYVLVAQKDALEDDELRNVPLYKRYDKTKPWKALLFLANGIFFNLILAVIAAFIASAIKGNIGDGFMLLGDNISGFFQNYVELFNFSGGSPSGEPSSSFGRLIEGNAQEIVVTNFSYLAALNIGLMIFNLLPFPPLDGFKFTEVFFEILFRKQLPRKLQIGLYFTGFVILILFSIAIFGAVIANSII